MRRMCFDMVNVCAFGYTHALTFLFMRLCAALYILYTSTSRTYTTENLYGNHYFDLFPKYFTATNRSSPYYANRVSSAVRSP